MSAYCTHEERLGVRDSLEKQNGGLAIVTRCNVCNRPIESGEKVVPLATYNPSKIERHVLAKVKFMEKKIPGFGGERKVEFVPVKRLAWA